MAYQQTHQMLLNLRVGKTVSNPLKFNMYIKKHWLQALRLSNHGQCLISMFTFQAFGKPYCLMCSQSLSIQGLQDFLGKLGQKHLLRPSRENSYWSGDRILEKTYIHTGIHEYVSHYVFTFAKITCHMYTVFIYTYTCNIYTYAYTHTHGTDIYI